MSVPLFITLVLALFLITNVAAFAKKGSRSFRVFSADPDSFSFWPIFLSMTGSICGGGTFLVVGQLGFEAGVPAYAYAIGAALSFLGIGLAAPFFRRLLEENQCATLIELVGRRYSNRVAVLFCVFNAVMTFFLTAGQFVGMYGVYRYLSSIITPFYLPFGLAFLCVVSLCLYPIIGGTRKDILTDVVQSAAVIVAMALLLLTMPYRDVFSAVASHSFTADLRRPGYGVGMAAGLIFIVPWLYPLRLDVWQRIRAARSAAVARRAMFAAAAVSFVSAGLFTTLGLMAEARGFDDPNIASLTLVLNSSFSILVVSVTLAAFFSAVLTASDTLINSTALFVSRLLFASEWQAIHTEGEGSPGEYALLRKTRFLGLAAAVLALALSFAVPSFIDLVLAGFSALLMFAPFLLGFFNIRYRSERGGFYGPLIGLFVFLPLFFFYQPKAAFLPAAIVSFAVYFTLLRTERSPVLEGQTADTTSAPKEDPKVAEFVPLKIE